MFGAKSNHLKKRLREAEEAVARLEAWKAQTMDHFEMSYVQQIELAGEIMTSIRRSAEISQRASGMLRRVNAFEADFGGASEDLGNIDKQMAELVRSISSTGSAIEQTSSAVEEISASIERISQESTSRFQDMLDLASLSKTGQDEMASTLNVIGSVTAGIDDLHSFLEIINDIAGKTSILSMNAAIQAAHAGEVGKGFAVVADEIRRLAESSATNASGIAKKLKVLIDAIHRAQQSSQKTSAILTETEEKVGRASLGFQEIEQGAKELAIGGREMLQGISSLKEVAHVMGHTSDVIATNSTAITGRIAHLRKESQNIEGDISKVRHGSADLNGSGMNLTQTAVKQLDVSRSFMNSGNKMDPARIAILTLQHLAWVTRVRAVLDGTLQLASSSVADHHTCDLGKWLDQEANEGRNSSDHFKKIYADHERMHAQAKSVVALFHAEGKRQEAEEEFPKLVEFSEAVVNDLKEFARGNGEQSVFILWKKEFELNVPFIDGQHKRLVDMINRLFSALQAGEGRRMMEDIVSELVDYTKTHFGDEEKLFLASDYPGKKPHLEQHKEFIATVARVQEDFRAGKVVMGSETLDFLKAWLLKHIQGTDRGYVQFVKR